MKIKLYLSLLFICSFLQVIAANKTDFFRSKKSGIWQDTSIWESSSDSLSWTSARMFPDSTARSIFITAFDSVQSNSTENAKFLTVLGILNDSSNGNSLSQLTIISTGGLTIYGTYLLHGNQPLLQGSATCHIYGTVRVDNNTGGKSDNFAQNLNVYFHNGSVFNWHTSQIFGNSGVTYFPNSILENPIFLVSVSTGLIGGVDSTVFYGKFIVDSAVSVTFEAAGEKKFKDGLGGAGQIVHDTTCGTFVIFGTTAVIDGSVKISIKKNKNTLRDIVIDSNAVVTISSVASLTVGTSTYPLAQLWVAGKLINNGSTPIDIQYGSIYIQDSLAGTGSFIGSLTYTNIVISGNKNISAGYIRFITNKNLIQSLSITRGSGTGKGSFALASDVIIDSLYLGKGIIETGTHTLTVNKSNSVNFPLAYNSAWIATVDSLGQPLSLAGHLDTNGVFDGTFGFKIANVSGASDIYFPIGADTVGPNRLAINMNNSTTRDITVVVGKGDIGSTAAGRVNRIWYIHSSSTDTTNVRVTMKLFFTQQYVNYYPQFQDEVESSFDYDSVKLIGKNTVARYFNYQSSGTDINHYSFGHAVELSAVYSKNISSDFSGKKDGITNPNGQFSIIGGEKVVLPLLTLVLRAHTVGSYTKLVWESEQKNTFIVERLESSFFKKLSTTTHHCYVDSFPLSRSTYRIATTNADGKVIYSNIVSTGNNLAMQFFPNPCTSFVTISYAQGKEIGLYDMQGKPILLHVGAKNYETLHLISFPAGLYFLKIDGVFFKLLKTR